MVIYYLLATLLIMLILCYFIFKRDIMSPPFLAVAGFVFSSICVIINYDYWHVDEISWLTYNVIVGGLAVFIISALVVYSVFDTVAPESRINISARIQKPAPIYIARINVIVFLIFSAVILVIYYHQVIRVASAHGGGSTFYELMSNFRQATAYSVLSLEDNVPLITRLGFSAVYLGGSVCLCICVNNLFCGEKPKPELVVASFMILAPILSSNRGMIARFIFMAIFIFYIIYMRSTGWKKIKRKYIWTIIVISLLGLIIFCVARIFIGRGMDKSPIYYVTYYFGGPIRLLDLYLKSPVPKDDIWGRETFYSVNSLLGTYFNIDKLEYIYHKEFRSIYGVSLGNVYTAFRSYIHDFGYIGMVTLTSLFAIIQSLFWNIIRRTKATNISSPLLIFVYLYHSVILMFYMDWFYSQPLSTLLKTIVILIVMNWYFTKLKIVMYSKKPLALNKK